MTIQEEMHKTEFNLTDEPLYQVAKLLSEFKKRSIKCTTRPTYLKYEAAGILTAGKYSLVQKNRVERLFTIEEISENIRRMKEWLKQNGELPTKSRYKMEKDILKK